MLGPAAFLGGWAAGASRTNRDYSHIEDAISRLAAVGNTSRRLMTAGFVGFGVGIPVYAAALRETVEGPAWVAAAMSGVATLGVAAASLERNVEVDHWHARFAVVGALSRAAVPLLASGPLLQKGNHSLARFGRFAGGVGGLVMVLSASRLPTGLCQRVGATVADLWIAASAVAVAAGRLDQPPRPGQLAR